MLLLDLFCGAGGASVGYSRAGFKTIGVDCEPMPRYPFEFWQLDTFQVLRALTSGATVHGYSLDDFDAIHASPPCQLFSQLAIARGDGTHLKYPNLIPETKAALIATGKPYVIENIERAPMEPTSILVCGTQFGAQYKWHRKFDCNFPVEQLRCNHDRATTYASPFTMPNYNRIKRDFGASPNPETRFHLWRGITWTKNLKEKRQAIPPNYAEYIGGHLMTYLRSAAVKAAA